MNVKVDTGLLESGANTIKKYFEHNSSNFNYIKGISPSSCESLASFKTSITHKFSEYSDFQSRVSSKLKECAECLIGIDNNMGNSLSTSIADINSSQSEDTSSQATSTADEAIDTDALTAQLSKEALNMEPGVHILDYTLSNGNTMQYVVRVPQKATENMPVIFWIAGSGEQSSANKISTIGPIKAAEKLGENRFLIIQPVLSTNVMYTQNLKDMDLFIDEMQPIYKYDANRIILSGYSSGGDATWYLGNATTDKYAGIAPASINKPDTHFSLENLKNSNLPIYAMAGEYDWAPANSNERIINEYKSINPDRDLTAEKIAYLDHNAFDDEGYTQDFFDWCIKQNRLNNS